MTKEPQPKSNEAYKTISEVGKALQLTTSTLRFWEKEFKQIKPHIINKRRYYSQKNIRVIEKIKDLVYEKGYTLTGAKKHFDNLKVIDDNADTTNLELKNKIKKILALLNSAKEELEDNIST